jgi:hypothetical protein
MVMAAALAIAACSRELPAPPPAQPRAPQIEGQPVATLAGEWRVAGVDGQPFDENYGLALSADGSQVWWAPRCAGFVRSYRIEGMGVRFEPAPPPAASSGSPSPVCQIGIPSRLNDVFAALDSAERVVRTPANAIEISGGGRSLTLFSQ